MNLLNLILNGLAGAATGYITNDIAVRMLFRKIGPFGGVLEETREEFIFNLSNLVEEKIINYKTISGELESPEFKKELSKLLDDIVSVRMREELQGLNWQDIAGFQQSIEGLASFGSQKDFVADILTALASNNDLAEAISPEQLEIISENLVQLGQEFFQDPEKVAEFIELLLAILAELQDQEQLTENIQNLLQKGQHELQAREGKLNEVLLDLFAQLELEDYFQERLTGIFRKPLSEVLLSTERLAAKNNLAEEILSFLETNTGKSIGEDLLEALFTSLQSIDLTLPELLGENWQEVLFPLLQKELPQVISRLLTWLENNRDELEERVDKAIGEVLAQGRGLRNSIKQVLYKALQGNVAQRYGIIGGVMSDLAAGENIDRLASDLSQELTEIFEKKSLGWFFYRISELEFFDKTAWYEFLLAKFKDYFTKDFSPGEFIVKLSGELNDLSLEDLVGEEFAGRLARELPYILCNISKKIIISPRAAEEVSYKLATLIHNFSAEQKANKALVELFSAAAQDDNFASSLRKIILLFTTDKLTDRSLGFKEYQLNALLADRLSDFLELSIESWLAQWKEESPVKIIDRLELQDDYQERMTAFFLELIENNLPELLRDRVSQAVADNLFQLSVEDMRKVVESFMGTELKPLTYFGGLLGFIAGLMLEILGGGLLAATAGPGRLLIAMLVYGFVGFLTNVLAIKMIFRPYQPKKIAGLQVPLTPGLFARNQERFAIAVGDFVQDDLLEPYRISSLFQQKRSEIENLIHAEMSKNNYRRVRALTRVSSTLIATKTVDWLADFIYQDSEKISEGLVGNIENWEITSDLLLKIKENIIEVYQEIEIEENILSDIILKINDYFLTKDQALNNYISSDQKDNLVEFLLDKSIDYGQRLFKASGDKEDKKLANYKQKSLEQIISLGQGLLVEELSARNIKELIPTSSRSRITTASVEGLLGSLKEGRAIPKVSKVFQDYLQRYKKTEGDWGENLIFLLEENFNSILDFFIVRLEDYFQKNRAEIKDAASYILEEEMKSGEFQQGWISSALFRGAYYLTDGRGTLDEIIDILLDDELPEFLNANRRALKSILQPFIIKISQGTAEEVLKRAKSEDWQQLIVILLEKDDVARNFQRFFRRFFEIGWNLELSLADFKYGQKGFLAGEEIFDRQISSFITVLDDKENKKLSQIIEPGLKFLVETSLYVISPANIWQSFTGLKPSAEKNNSVLTRGEKAKIEDKLFSIFALGQNFLLERKESIKLKDILGPEVLSRDLHNFILSLSQEDKFLEELKDILDCHISRSTRDYSQAINQESLEFIFNLLLTNSIAGLEDHFQALLHTLEIKKIAIKQVENMEPAAIEDLFNSFAGPYLTKLKLYGWSGSLVGLLTEFITGLRV